MYSIYDIDGNEIAIAQELKDGVYEVVDFDENVLIDCIGLVELFELSELNGVPASLEF